ncbi:MAG: hypothetical protein A2Y33_14040 [Spirochaetes bacterium GWF1_51_8]|nr:MAG: hypothetical protein A2Y33_14040 [Spirochaetes bacterium GWF1_51_8]
MTDVIPSIIRTKEEYDNALSIVEELIDRDPSPESKEGRRLETWSVLIVEYEKEQFPIHKPDLVELIKFRMEHLNRSESIETKNLVLKTLTCKSLSQKRPYRRRSAATYTMNIKCRSTSLPRKRTKPLSKIRILN